MANEREDLGTHVDLCELRYKQLHQQMDVVEKRVNSLEQQFNSFKDSIQHNFDEVKDLIGRGQHEKFKAVATACASIMVGLLGLIGYIVVHMSK